MQIARHARAREVLIRAVRRRDVVVDPVTEVGAQREAGVELAEAHVRRVAQDPLGRGIVERPAVGIVDDTVAVLIDIHVGRRRDVVNRLALRVVALLEDEERVDRYARLQHFDHVPHAARDAAGQDPCDALVWVDFSKLVLVVARRETHVPIQLAARLRLQDFGIECELDAVVLHAADVGRDEVAQVRAGSNRDVEQQVTRVFRVPIDRPTDALSIEAVVDPHIICIGLLPADVGIDGAGPDRRDVIPAELHLGERVTEGVRRVV